MGLITIELLEDYRTENGSGYNAFIDQDIHVDAYGFPYFPAYLTRLSLMEIGKDVLSNDEFEGIFGSGSEDGSLVLEHALIGSRQSLLWALKESEDKILTNPLLVLSEFSKIEKYFHEGKECTYRVLDAGLMFEQCFTLDEKYADAFSNLITRCDKFMFGSGKIRMSVDWNVDKSFVYGGLSTGDPCNSEICVSDKNKRMRMNFRLKLLSQTCVKMPLDVMCDTCTHIPGELVRSSLDDNIAMPENVKVSFAFPEVEGKRTLPVTNSFMLTKADKTQLRDKLSEGRNADDFEQLKRLGGCYIDDVLATNIRAVSVETECGKIVKSVDGELKTFTFEAISPNQTFLGFFEGEAEELNEVARYVANSPYLKIGEFTECGLGLCQIEIVHTCSLIEETTIEASEFRVDVVSPLALKSGNGLYCESLDIFLAELKRIFNDDDVDIELAWRNTEVAQGFSQNWIAKMPVMHLISGGSSFLIKRKNGGNLAVKTGSSFVGELNEFGYGEINVVPMKHTYYRTIEKVPFERMDVNIQTPADKKPGLALINSLNSRCARRLAHSYGRGDAREFCDSFYLQVCEKIKQALGVQTVDAAILEEYLSGICEVGKFLTRN